MKEMILLVVECQEYEPEEEHGEADVPRVVEALVGLDAAVDHLDPEGDDVDDQVKDQQPKVFALRAARIEKLSVDESFLDKIVVDFSGPSLAGKLSKLFKNLFEGQVSLRVFPPKFKNLLSNVREVESVFKIREKVSALVRHIFLLGQLSLFLKFFDQVRHLAADDEVVFGRVFVFVDDLNIAVDFGVA